MSKTVTADFIYSGLSDYWSGLGARWDDNKGCLFASYGRSTTLRELVDGLVQDYISGGDCDEKPAFEDVTPADIRAAIVACFNDRGIKDYKNGARCEFAIEYAQANPRLRDSRGRFTADDEDGSEYPQVIFLITVDEDEDQNEDEQPDEDSDPQEDDIITEDHARFYQSGKLVLWVQGGDSTVSADWSTDRGYLGTFDSCEQALRAYMEQTQYWPNCWSISDHGNAHLIDLSVKGDK